MSNRDLKVSQERLWSLVEQRCQPGADVSELDRRIWDLVGEKWAVVFSDLSGFSRRVEQFGIPGALTASRRVLDIRPVMLAEGASLPDLQRQRALRGNRANESPNGATEPPE